MHRDIITPTDTQNIASIIKASDIQGCIPWCHQYRAVWSFIILHQKCMTFYQLF